MNLESLMNNPYAWVILSICTIAAFVFAIYTWIVGKSRKELSCYKNSYTIVEGGESVIPELQLLYQNKKIKNLTITKYALWNSGNGVLYCNDIVSSRPIKILIDEQEEILDARIINQSDETNMFTVSNLGEKETILQFEYADKNDGIVLQILHTGDEASINVDCKIKGGRDLKVLGKKNKKSCMNVKLKKTITFVLLSIEVVLTSFVTIVTLLLEWEIIPLDVAEGLNMKDTGAIRVLLTLLLILATIAVIIMYYKMFRKLYYIDIPAKLRKSMKYDAFEK